MSDSEGDTGKNNITITNVLTNKATATGGSGGTVGRWIAISILALMAVGYCSSKVDSATPEEPSWPQQS